MSAPHTEAAESSMHSSPIRYERNDAQPSQSHFGDPSTAKGRYHADIIPQMDEQCRHELPDAQTS